MRKKIMIVVIGMTLITMLAGYGCHEKNTKYESAMQNADSYLKELVLCQDLVQVKMRFCPS